jgi:type IV pilus assembly protein PilN
MKYIHNLATRAYVNRRTLYMCYALIGSLLTIILLFNLIRGFSLNSDINRNRENIETIESNILARTGVETADYSESNYQDILKRIENANEILLRDSFRWTRFLEQIEAVVPRQVRILSIDPSYKDQTIKLSGQAKNLKSLKLFLDNLIESGHYSQVFIDQQRTESKSTMISFAIQLEGAF